MDKINNPVIPGQLCIYAIQVTSLCRESIHKNLKVKTSIEDLFDTLKSWQFIDLVKERHQSVIRGLWNILCIHNVFQNNQKEILE